MAADASISVPTGRTIGMALGQYGTGLVAGLGFNVVRQLTGQFLPGLGGGIVGSAIAAALTGALVPGRSGEIIATTLGFQQGTQGLGSLLGGFGGGGGAALTGGAGGGRGGIRVI